MNLLITEDSKSLFLLVSKVLVVRPFQGEARSLGIATDLAEKEREV